MKRVGYALAVLAALALVAEFLFLATESPFPDERKPEVRVMMSGLITAVKSFQADYGRYPGIRVDGRYETAEDNARLMNVLRAIDTTENPRKIAYFEAQDAKLRNDGSYSGGFTPKGVLLDPWGHPYRIRIKAAGSEWVANPYALQGQGEESIIRSDVIVWSFGKDGLIGKNGDGKLSSDSDDWVSWQ